MGQDKHEILVCDCEKTMRINGAAVAKATGLPALEVHSHLCRSGIGAFEKALKSGIRLCIGCTQEAPLFSEIAAEAGAPDPIFFNIRENAGWTEEKSPPAAKMAALIAAARLETKPVRTKSITSDGLCLVYGDGQAALDAALILNRRLSVTLLLRNSDGVVLPSVLDIPVFCGQLRSATGTLGAFSVTVDGYAAMLPSSRSQLQFAMARDGAQSNCSVIVDLTGGNPLFANSGSRDGYFRADPGNPASVTQALFDASDYSGEFEKPIYVTHQPDLCAHSRSQKTGCTKCIDNCPPGAITPHGDIVSIDTGICGGCGNCAAHCPSGAAQYHYPGRAEFITRIQTLASTYHDAGGRNPVLLVHNAETGAALIGAMARFGRGLPAHVIPHEVHAITSVGHDALVSALAAGFSNVVLLADRKNAGELGALAAECDLTETLLGALDLGKGRISIAMETDPDELESALWNLKPSRSICHSNFTATAAKRETARAAIALLAGSAKKAPEHITLPQGAPYGNVVVDTDACTLCLACVSSCPSDALRDTPETLELRFVESACVQCGICKATCPESAISLQPRANLSPAAMQPVTLYAEDPFECTRCGTPFASKSTIDRIRERLGGKHSMYDTDDRVALLSMCDNCRLEVLAEKTGDPFAIASRPRIRTTDDYIEAEKSGLSVEDFISKD